MLEVKNISFSYNKKDMVLKNLSLNINSGEILGVIAPSGYGKSTLGEIISGYLKPQEGSILLDGKEIDRFRGFRNIQMIHQNPEQSVNQNWKIGKILNEGFEVSEEIKENLGIENFWLDKFPCELSGGELQRVCIARIMSEKTKYIVADEITAMLDSITQAQILKRLIKFTRYRNIGLMLISHNISLIKKVADRSIYLEEINNIL